MAPVIDLTITRGKTLAYSYLYAEDARLYLPISAMPSKAPVRLTVTAHGVPEGWPVQVQCVKAPAELNSGADDYYLPTVVDADTLELNALNAHCWKAFSGSGLVVCSKPMNLTGWSARAQVRDKVGGSVLFSWHSDPLQAPDGAIEVDVARSAFVLRVTAAKAASLTWKRGVYDLEAIAPTGEVYPLTAISSVTVADEVTA